MDFRDILIHIDDTPQCAARVELAINLARQHGAHLTGLFATTQPPYGARQGARRKQAVAAEEKFRKAVGRAGVPVDWILPDSGISDVNMAEIISHYAHTKDILIISQAIEGLREGPPTDLPERVIFGSGRPVLVVPGAGKFTTVGNCSIVAWRGGRASARAVNDSLPLLMKSRTIYALTIKTSDDRLLKQTSGCNVCSHLQRYGMACIAEEISAADIPVANILMNFAWDKACDLLVVGVYAQTIGKKLVFGPVGRHLLRDMTLPVLMSH